MINANPLFPSADPSADSRQPEGFVLPQHTHTIQPASGTEQTGTNEAIELIRAKLERIYADAPDPFAEAKDAATAAPHSKHQQYMDVLSKSGKSPVEIQAAWQDYYANLPDDEKHRVWQEYYTSNGIQAQPANPVISNRPIAAPRPGYVHKPAISPTYIPPQPTVMRPPREPGIIVSTTPERSLPHSRRGAGTKRAAVTELRERIQQKVAADGRLRAKDHLHSLMFGLGVGMVSLIIFLFGFFNEVIIAPFLQPSRNVGATPIIINPSDVAVTSTPEVIIPKIHLEIPADYSQTSTNEATIETALENGIVHYPSTVMPGQTGNAAFFGHSSNNIFNPGKYKFAFVLLHDLMPGDTFYLTYNRKVYVYKVYDKRIVEPSEVNVLNNIAGHPATATLITCDPPGTSLHRLVVVGDQISPDPTGQPGGTNTSAAVTTTPLPGNGPSLFTRLWHSIF